MLQPDYTADQAPSWLARWTSRTPLFLAVLLIVTLFLHRVFSLPTPVALNIAIAVFAGAALVLVMALIAGLDIWITGRQGASRIVSGSAIALALLALPAWAYSAGRAWPELNDVTTDTANPPEYLEAVTGRPAGANTTDYPVTAFAGLQKENYPDIKPVDVPRSAEESFEIALQALAKLRYATSLQSPPDEEPGEPGIIEFTDRTQILGFTDDVVIRVTGDEKTSRIDVRSSSRFGRNDFGRNAARVRDILKEVVGRLEASVPEAGGGTRAVARVADETTKQKRAAALAAKRAKAEKQTTPARHDAARKAQESDKPRSRVREE